MLDFSRWRDRIEIRGCKMNPEETRINLERVLEHNINMYEVIHLPRDKKIYEDRIKQLAENYKTLTGNFYRRKI